MLWEDTCPKSFDDFYQQSPLVNNLKTLANHIKTGDCFQNLIIYGQEQCGKYTLAKCLLQEIYGMEIYKTTDHEHQVRQNCSNYSIKITKSLYHYETSLTGLQYADKSMLISLINTYFSTLDISRNSHKIIIIKYFDELTKPAQYALRRKMETGCRSVRYILLVKSINKIETSIKSRCFCIRCPRLSDVEIKGSLIKLLTKRHYTINEEIEQMIDRSVQVSQNIISNAIYYLTYMLETGKMDVECPISVAIDNIKQYLHKRPLKHEAIRECIATLQLSKISHQKIFQAVIKEAISYFNKKDVETDRVYIYQIINLSSKYSVLASSTNKFGIAVEAFIISVFNIIQNYKRYLKAK